MLARSETSENEGAVDALRAFISDGGYTPGDRLPPERELIGGIGVSRTTLRKALDVLEREGRIWRHVGKGTFVARRLEEDDSSALVVIAQQLTPFRMVRARLAIEPAIAREAAVNASKEAVDRIKRIMERARDASSWLDYETQDNLFHRAVAEAADNMLLLALFDQLNEVRRAVALGSVVRQTPRPPRTHTSFEEHAAIAAAIENRDVHAAQDAMRRHISSVSARLFGED